MHVFARIVKERLNDTKLELRFDRIFACQNIIIYNFVILDYNFI